MIKNIFGATAALGLFATPALAAPTRPAAAVPMMMAEKLTVSRVGASKKAKNDAIGGFLIPLLAGLAVVAVIVVVVAQSDG